MRRCTARSRVHTQGHNKALTGNRPPTLAFVLPALVSALLWPWVCTLLRAVHRRMRVN